MSNDKAVQLVRIKTTLWVLVGVGCGIAALYAFIGSLDVLPAPPAMVSLWLALAGFVLLFGGMATEFARGRGVPLVRWVALVLFLAAAAWAGPPFLVMLAPLGLGLGIAAAVALIALLVAERLAPAPEADRPAIPSRSARSGLYVGGMWLGPVRIAALAWVVGAVLGVTILELAQWQAFHIGTDDTRSARTVTALRDERVEPQQRLALQTAAVTGAAETAMPVPVNALLIDGNWSDKVVVFDHEAHKAREGGMNSCSLCHHRNLPMDRGTSCAACHRKQDVPSDPFGHGAHVRAMGGNASCEQCHEPGNAQAVRTATKSCAHVDCHGREPTQPTMVRTTLPLADGIAPAYVDAMHGLCVHCHQVREQEKAAEGPILSRCVTCHRHERTASGELRPDPLLLVAPALETPPAGEFLEGDRHQQLGTAATLTISSHAGIGTGRTN